MTGIPGALIDSLKNLNDTITTTIGRRNQRSLDQLTRVGVDLVDVGTNLYRGFSKADKLQIKSLSVGSSLSKLLETNNKSLSKLNGSPLANAQELLDNITFGLRKNSDATLALNNEMRLTGQDTEALRAVLGDLSMLTMDNQDAMDSLVKATKNLSHEYGVTSEYLLRSLKVIDESLRAASLVTDPQKFSEVFQELAAKVGEKGLGDLKQVMRLLTDPTQFASRASLGLSEAGKILTDTSTSTNEKLEGISNILSKATSTINKLSEAAKSSFDPLMTVSTLLGQFGNPDQLIALKNINGQLQNNSTQLNSIRDINASYLDSLQTTDERARAFYEMAVGTTYPLLNKALPMIMSYYGLNAIRAGAVGLGNLGKKSGSNLLSTLAVGTASFTRFLGPIGLLASVVVPFIPDLWDLLTDSSKDNKESKRILAEIRDNDKKEESTQAKVSLSGVISKELAQMINGSSRNRDDGIRELTNTLNALNSELKDMKKTSSITKFGFNR